MNGITSAEDHSGMRGEVKSELLSTTACAVMRPVSIGKLNTVSAFGVITAISAPTSSLRLLTPARVA